MKNKFFITLFACLLPWMAGAQQIISKQNNVAEKDYIAYLFTYFTGNHISEEAVCYAVSTDGYTYWALNDNKPVIDSKIISSTGGVRDPHILRCEDGKTFYMVVTDMVSDNGWDSNRAMVLLKSNDLVVTGDLTDLFELDLGENYLAATRSCFGVGVGFNAGVLLINNQKWKSENIRQKLIELTEKEHENVFLL